MPKNAADRVEEIRDQEDVAPEVKAQQLADVAEAFGPETEVARSSRARTIDSDDDGTMLNYTDLLDSARAEGVQSYDVAGALSLAGKDRMTRTELRSALRSWAQREIK